jgi:hypothetical protein
MKSVIAGRAMPVRSWDSTKGGPLIILLAFAIHFASAPAVREGAIHPNPTYPCGPEGAATA